ncbi:MAG TPA: FkbM family methyltransferase [Terriglobales bacterium]|nr:FkbM family methyltransferase [Terriglobales bacterium]
MLLRICARILPGFSNYRLNVSGVGWITINLKDSSGIAWLNYSLGDADLEDGLICAVTRLAPENPILWDIGANAGFFAAGLIQRLKSYTEVRLFEPNPKFVSALQELADRLANVYPHNLALSDKVGDFTLYIPLRESSTASFTLAPNSRPVTVQCTTGDAFLRNSGSPDPDVIIIDTEGNDCRVIRGLAELIERKRPIIFFENIFETAETIRQALPRTYRDFTVDDKSGELVEGLDKSRGHNSVLVPQK